MQDLTEEEMRRALFGALKATPQPQTVPAAKASKALPAPRNKSVSKVTVKPFTPRLRVTLSVGNEFEGRVYEFVHEANTLSTLLAEQEAVKAARKKYKFVSVVSVQPV